MLPTNEQRYLESVEQFASLAFRAMHGVNVHNPSAFEELKRSLLWRRDAAMKLHEHCRSVFPEIERPLLHLFSQAARVVLYRGNSPRSIRAYLQWLHARASQVLRYLANRRPRS